MFYRNMLLFAVVSLISAASFAEETAPAPGTTPAESVTPAGKVDETHETVPVSAPESAPKVEAEPAPPVAAPVENESERLKRARASLVLQKIERFRSAVKETTQEKGVFSKLFSSDSNPIDIELLQDMRHFVEAYANLPQTDEVLYLSAFVHKRMKSYQAAALDLIMLKVMYPESSFVFAANKQLKEFSNDQLSKFAATIAKADKQIDSLSGDMDQRAGAFLEFLGTFREETFAAPIAAECVSFLARNANFAGDDVIENAIAHQAMLIDNEIALYRFGKLLALYPASKLRADSLFSMATIQRGKLKLYDKAAKNFLALIENHPDSNETKLGYEALATMYNEDMRDYPNAIKTYDAIVAKYKDDPIVLRGLQALEKVYETKTNQPDKAINTYLKLSEVFPTGTEGMNALIAAERIAVSSTKNWAVAIAINERIVARAPNSEEAMKALYASADITETKLGDKGKAKEMYQDFIQAHPAHSLAKDAQKRIDALTKK